MATHSSILAWRISWIEESGGLQTMGCKELDTTEQLTLHFFFNDIIPATSPATLVMTPFTSVTLVSLVLKPAVFPPSCLLSSHGLLARTCFTG